MYFLLRLARHGYFEAHQPNGLVQSHETQIRVGGQQRQTQLFHHLLHFIKVEQVEGWMMHWPWPSGTTCFMFSVRLPLIEHILEVCSMTVALNGGT